MLHLGRGEQVAGGFTALLINRYKTLVRVAVAGM